MTSYHPDVLACHTQFGGDLDAMQALYDRPDHLAALEAQSAQIAELQAEMVRAWNAFGAKVCDDEQDLEWLPRAAYGHLDEQIAAQTTQLATAEAQIADLKRALDTAQYRAAQNGKWLGELLAVIHRDGGHYQATHGDEKAVNDAHAVWASLRSALDTARHDAMEEAAQTAEGFGTPYAIHTNDGAMMFRASTQKIAAAIRALSASPLSQGGQADGLR